MSIGLILEVDIENSSASSPEMSVILHAMLSGDFLIKRSCTNFHTLCPKSEHSVKHHDVIFVSYHYVEIHSVRLRTSLNVYF